MNFRLITHRKILVRKHVPILEPEVEFRRRMRSWRHISAADQNTFTKSGALGSSDVWDASFEHPRCRAAVISRQLNRYNSAADCPISLKFCTTTNMSVYSGTNAPPGANQPGQTPRHAKHPESAPTR